MTADAASTGGPLRWLVAIGEARLRKREKLVLYAFVRFVNWDTGEAFPAIDTLAQHAALSARSVQFACRALADAGVLSGSAGTAGGFAGGRGISNRVRLDIARIEFLKGEIPARKGRNRCAQRVKTLREKGAMVSPKPSIQNHPDEQTIGTDHAAEPESARAGAGWMDGREPAQPAEDVRGYLARLGVNGRNLDALAATPSITAEAVRREWASINADRRVRNRAGVLVSRLSQQHGITLPGGHHISSELLSLNQRLRRLRDARRSP